MTHLGSPAFSPFLVEKAAFRKLNNLWIFPLSSKGIPKSTKKVDHKNIKMDDFYQIILILKKMDFYVFYFKNKDWGEIKVLLPSGGQMKCTSGQLKVNQGSNKSETNKFNHCVVHFYLTPVPFKLTPRSIFILPLVLIFKVEEKNPNFRRITIIL